MKIKSKHILYGLVVLVLILLSKICYDCYSFKEGMTTSEYAEKLADRGKAFYIEWYNNFWSGGSKPWKIDALNKWNIDDVKKYFHNDAAKPGEIISVLVFDMRKSDVNMIKMNKNISNYLSDISTKFKKPLQNQYTVLNSLPDVMKGTIRIPLSKIEGMLSILDTIEKTVDKYRTFMYDERVKIDPVYGAYEVVLAIDNNMVNTLNKVVTKRDLEMAASTQKPGSLIRIAEQAANGELSDSNFNKIMDYLEKMISIRYKYDGMKPTPSTYTKNRLANFRTNIGETINKYADIVIQKDPIYGAYLLCSQSIAMKNSFGLFTNDVMKTAFSQSLNGSLIRKAEYGSRTTLVESTFNDVKKYLEKAISFKRDIIDKDVIKPLDNNQLKYWNLLKSGITKSIDKYVDILKNQDSIYGRYILMNLWYAESTNLLKESDMKTTFSMTYNGSTLKTAKFSNAIKDWKKVLLQGTTIQTLIISLKPVDGNTQRLLNELKGEVQKILTQAKDIVEKDKLSQEQKQKELEQKELEQKQKELEQQQQQQQKELEQNQKEQQQEQKQTEVKVSNLPENNIVIDKIDEIEDTVSDNQLRYDSILNKLNILQTNYDTHVSDSDAKLNNLITNNNSMFQEYATKLEDLQQNNNHNNTLERAEQIAKEAALKAIENQKLSNQENNKQIKNEPVEIPTNSSVKESNTHSYNSACPSIGVSNDCEKCKPMDEDYIRNDKCRNMYCNVIDSKDVNAYIYSCSPVMLDAVNKIKSVCEGCPEKKVVSVPKTDEQKMFEHAQTERNHMLSYGWNEKNHHDMYDVKKTPSYGTGLFQDINLENNSPFYENPFKASYPGMLDN